jgi:hypothetical protein
MTGQKNEEISSLKKKANIYYKEKTFTFIRFYKFLHNKNQEFIFNGFIIKNFDDYLVFFDIYEKKEFPIEWDFILKLDTSLRTDISYEEAIKILEEYKKQNPSTNYG